MALEENEMKIFLIGKNGQVGAEINQQGLKMGFKIIAFGSKELDITDHDKVRQKIEKHKPDVVINTAAYHVLSDSERHIDTAFKVNVYAVKNLADICNKYNIRFINYSSDKVFDGKKRTPYTETDKTNPLQIYGITKLTGEIIAANYNNDTLNIRTCGIYGGLTGSTVKKGNFVLYILKESKLKTELEISSEQIASFVHAKDLAKATLQLLQKNVPKGIYNIVNEGCGSWAEFAQEIVKLNKLKMKIIPVNRKGIYGDTHLPEFTAMDISKIKKLGITLPPWQTGLQEYLHFLRSQS
jgi:dTDP-4-dehydrorhamnose reductase